MPNPQAAKQSTYDLSIPPVLDSTNPAWKAQAKYHTHGPVTFIFTSPLATKELSLQIEVSDDNENWADIAAATHGVDELVTLPARGRAVLDVKFRPGIDKYVRVIGSGGDRCQMMLVSGEGLEPMNVEVYRNDFS